MDLIVELPTLSDFNSILVIVDCLTKMAHFLPRPRGTSSVLLAYLFIDASYNYDQSDWVKLLPLAEFPYNNAMCDATKQSPFYAYYSFNSDASVPPIGNPETVLQTSLLSEHLIKIREDL